MGRILLVGVGLGFLGTAFSTFGIDLTQARFTEVINEVNIIAEGSGPRKRAEINDLFKVPDILQTGARSRAELRANDETITRVGANTVFSFESQGRAIRLQKGSILFHSPTGRGGGVIKTGSATASVLGTTITVVTTKEGGFKLLVQEGKAKVELPNGVEQTVNAGQLVFILPNADRISPPISFDLERQVEGSNLIQGFHKPISSLKKIDRAVMQQNRLVKRGRAEKTSLLIADIDEKNKLHLIDNNTLVQSSKTTPASALLPQDALEILNGLSESDKRGTLAKYLFGLDAEITTPVLDRGRIVRVNGFKELEQNWTRNEDLTAGYYRGRSYAFLAKNLSFNTEGIDVTAQTKVAFDAKRRDRSLKARSDFSLTSFYFLAAGDVTFQDQISFDNAPVGLFVLSKGKLKTEPETVITINPGQQHSQLTLSSLGSQIYRSTKIEGPQVLQFKSQDFINFFSASLNAETVVDIQAPTIVMGQEDQRRNFINSPIVLIQSRNMYLRATDFNANNVMLSARTLVLQDVNFSARSDVALLSANGNLAPNPNTGQTVVPGDVNFINDVTYGGEPAQNFVGDKIQIGKR